MINLNYHLNVKQREKCITRKKNKDRKLFLREQICGAFAILF